MMMTKTVVRLSSAISLSLLMFGCGSSGDGGGGGTGGTTGDEVLDALTSLGVPVEETPRLDDESEALPDDYSPFGSAQSFDTIEEILLLGPQLNNSASLLTIYELQSQNDRPIYEKEEFFAPSTAETPWASSVGATPDSLRVAAAADIDGDGLDEVAILYREGTQGPITLLTYQETVQGGVIGFAESQSLLISTDLATDLSLEAGDFNGDGLSDFAVGLSFGTTARLLFVSNVEGTLALSEETATLPQAVADSQIQLSMASGNLDYDAGNELIVVVNELFQSMGADAGSSRYFIFDDAKAGYAALSDNLIRATLSEVNRTAIVADVATGDIDGDNVDEIVFAGLQNFDPAGTCGYRYLMVALDDNKRDNVPLGGLDLVPNIHEGCSDASPGELRYVHVNVLDLDGDGLPEVQANQYVFHDFATTAPWTQYVWGTDVDDLPLKAVIDDGNLFDADGTGFTGRFALDNSSMMVGDATADGRQNIVFYSQATNRLETWGLSNPDDGAPPLTDPIFAGDWRAMSSLIVEDPGSEPIRPILVASNVNFDSLALRYSEGEYQLVFTEPILIAVLAAAPCDPELGQDLGACRTSFGTAESDTVTEETAFSVSASATVGFGTDVITVAGVGASVGSTAASLEVVATLKASASAITSKAYTLTKRIVYTTGPIEDTVIFTTVPLDRYTYEVTSHPVPELIGTKVVISLPRAPIEVQVERERYNANVVTGGPMIDAMVLSHAPGVPSSYPSSSDKGELLASFEGFELGPQSVGNSGGNSSLSINVATEAGTGVGYGAEFEYSVTASAGALVTGYTVGGSADKSLQIIHGEESEYTGTVADMDLPTAEFGQERYSWGLFTYIFDDPVSAQQYEIVNYWVE